MRSASHISRARLLPSVVLLISSLALAPQLLAQQSAEHTTHGDPANRADKLAWAPAPKIFPAGAQMVLLQGDPGSSEMVTARLKFPDQYVIPPHWHPSEEHVTIIKGTLLVGMGDKFSEDALLPALEAGDFITAPARMNHFVRAQGETIVQVHMMGPFQLTYANPEDDPTT